MARKDKRFFAHIRFFAFAKKISHGLFKSAGGKDGKGTFALPPQNMYNIKLCTFCDIAGNIDFF